MHMHAHLGESRYVRGHRKACEAGELRVVEGGDLPLHLHRARAELANETGEYGRCGGTREKGRA